jgi:hypothetical protein
MGTPRDTAAKPHKHDIHSRRDPLAGFLSINYTLPTRHPPCFPPAPLVTTSPLPRDLLFFFSFFSLPPHTPHDTAPKPPTPADQPRRDPLAGFLSINYTLPTRHPPCFPPAPLVTTSPLPRDLLSLFFFFSLRLHTPHDTAPKPPTPADQPRRDPLAGFLSINYTLPTRHPKL